MIELFQTVATSLTGSTDGHRPIISVASNEAVTVTSASSSTTTFYSSLFDANDFFDGSANVSNHIKQVLFASSSHPNESFDSMMATIDVGNDTEYDRNGTVVREFIFDRTDVRIIFITLYSLVFFCCFFGKYPDGFMFVFFCFDAHAGLSFSLHRFNADGCPATMGDRFSRWTLVICL